MNKTMLLKKELPSWDLSDLYKSTQSQEINFDLSKLENLTTNFNKKYKGNVHKLSDKKFYNLFNSLEKIEKLSGRLISYAYLNYCENVSSEEKNKFLSDIQEKLNILNSTWESEKKILDTKRNLNERIDQAKEDLEGAQRSGDLTKASEIMYGLLPSLQKEYEELNKKEQATIINEVINAEDIASVVSKWTGIPLEKLIGGEKDKLINIEKLLEKRVIGQQDAIEKVSKAIKISKAGLQDPDKPLGSFLFLGPTGVGKTELSKALAEYVFDNEKQMLRLDMSEYMEKHSVSRLIGAPPGYVGYDEGGVLTEAVRRRPYQVVLFDEVEKAHPDVFNLLLQVLDDGILTDGHGRVVDFKQTIIILTSNLGAQALNDPKTLQNVETAKANVMDAVRSHFKPEFINRLDEIIIFNRLSKEHMSRIVDIQLKILQDRISSLNLKIELGAGARDWIAQQGYDPVYGARPLKRVIQTYLQNPIAELILAGKLSEGEVIEVTDGPEGLLIGEYASSRQNVKPDSVVLH